MTAAEQCTCIAVLDFQFALSHEVNEREKERKTERENRHLTVQVSVTE